MELNQLLLEQFDISQDDLTRAESYQKRFGGRLEQLLVNMGSLPDDQVASFYSQYLGIPLLELHKWQNEKVPEVDQEILSMLFKQQWVPIAVDDKQWVFACIFPLDLTVNE